VLSSSAFGNLLDDELVTRRLVELAAAEALMGMRSAAAAGDWARVEALLEAASRQFAGNEWVAAVLEAMRSIAAGRERERAMKEMMYSSSKLRSRLAAKDESVAFCAAESASVPAYLRRKPAHKGKVTSRHRGHQRGGYCHRQGRAGLTTRKAHRQRWQLCCMPARAFGNFVGQLATLF
jgi:hypothetical protein